MSERLVRIMTGLITLTLAASLIVFGVLVGAGKLAPKYHISGTFSAAGQGLLPGSDVKVHGINIGQVTGVRLVKGKKLSDINAAHAADTNQFLDDLAKLSDEIANRAGDVVAGAKDLNVALPDLNAHADDLNQFLTQGSQLASDLADVLEANRPFLRKNVTEGGKTIQLLYDKRGQIPPVVRALTEFFQVLAEAGERIPCPQQGLPAGLECPAASTL